MTTFLIIKSSEHGEHAKTHLNHPNFQKSFDFDSLV